MIQSLESIFDECRQTPGLEKLKAVIHRGRAEIEKAQSHGYTNQAISEIRQKTRSEIRANIKQLADAEKNKILKKIEENKSRYEKVIENDPNRALEVNLAQIRINSLSKSEINIEVSRYLSGESKVWSPVELELICGRARQVIGEPTADMMRQAMVKNDYTEPWKRLTTEVEKQSLEVIERGELPLITERNETPGIMPISSNQIINMAEI